MVRCMCIILASIVWQVIFLGPFGIFTVWQFTWKTNMVLHRTEQGWSSPLDQDLRRYSHRNLSYLFVLHKDFLGAFRLFHLFQFFHKNLCLSESKFHARFTQSFNRPNLRFIVKPKKKVMEEILHYVKTKHPISSGIIYCLSRWVCGDSYSVRILI